VRPPLNHLMLNEGALADDFATILGYRTSHAGLVQSGDVPSSFYEPSAWAWFDGKSTLLKTAALTGASATVNTHLFTCWFSPEGDNLILGLFTAKETVSGEFPFYSNRVNAVAPNNRMKIVSNIANLYTTSTEYANAAAPVNANRYFMAAWVDQVNLTGTIAIFSGTAWHVVSGVTGAGVAWNFTLVNEIGIGRHFGVAGTHWWGRIANIWFKQNVTIDLTNAAARNALLVDPGAAGSGLGLGAPEIFFSGAADKYNTLTNDGSGGAFNTLLGLVSSSPYTQRRVATTNTQALNIAALTGLDNPLTAFTLSVWFKSSASPTTTTVLFALYGGTGVLNLQKSADATGNRLHLAITDSLSAVVTAADGPAAQSTRTSVAVNDAALHHAYIVASISGDYVEGYVDGVLAFTNNPVSSAGMVDFSTHVGARIGESASAALRWVGSIGDVWFADAVPSSHATPAARLARAGEMYNAGSPPLLSGFGREWYGTTPLLCVGFGTNAASWNTTAVNLGTGGTLTTTGTFVLE